MRRLARSLVRIVLACSLPAALLSACDFWPFPQPAGLVRPVFGFPQAGPETAGIRATISDGETRDSAIFFFMSPLLTGFEATSGYSEGQSWTITEGLPFDGRIEVVTSLLDGGIVRFTGTAVDPADGSVWIQVDYDESNSEFSVEQRFFFEDPTEALGQGVLTAFIYFHGDHIAVERIGDEYHYHDTVDVGIYVRSADPDAPGVYANALQLRQHELYRGPLGDTGFGVASLLGDTDHREDPASFPDPLGGFIPSGDPDISDFDHYGDYFAACSYASEYLAPFAYFCIAGSTPVAVEPAFSVPDKTPEEQWAWFHEQLPDQIDTGETDFEFGG
jgi:hypothetical protein